MDEIDKNAFPRGHQHQINWWHEPNLSRPTFLEFRLKEINMELVDRIALEETQKLLKILADNLTENTKKIMLPPGTRIYKFEKVEDYQPFLPEMAKIESTIVRMYSFFGMLVGYDKTTDTLFLAEFNKP